MCDLNGMIYIILFLLVDMVFNFMCGFFYYVVFIGVFYDIDIVYVKEVM